MADHLPPPQPAEVVPGQNCARKPSKAHQKPFRIRRNGSCAAKLRLLCVSLYFAPQSSALVLLRGQRRNQKLEFHSDRLLVNNSTRMEAREESAPAASSDAPNAASRRLRNMSPPLSLRTIDDAQAGVNSRREGKKRGPSTEKVSGRPPRGLSLHGEEDAG